MGSTESWALVLGVVMPWLVAVVNKPWWPRRAKAAVAVAASVAGGVLVCLATGAFASGPGTVVGTVMLVLVASQAVYGRLFAGSVKKLEEKTSRRPAETPSTTDSEQSHPEIAAETNPEPLSQQSQKTQEPEQSVEVERAGRHRA